MDTYSQIQEKIKNIKKDNHQLKNQVELYKETIIFFQDILIDYNMGERDGDTFNVTVPIKSLNEDFKPNS